MDYSSIVDALKGLGGLLGAATYTRPQDIQAVRGLLPSSVDNTLQNTLASPAANDALGVLGGVGMAAPRFGSVGDLSNYWTQQGVRNFIAERPARGQVQLSDLVVPKDAQGQGLGTQFMNDLTDFADKNGHTITLSPGARDPYYGTTSQSRLVDFYKRFGFVQNKGRNMDYSISDSMYRLPQK